MQQNAANMAFSRSERVVHADSKVFAASAELLLRRLIDNFGFEVPLQCGGVPEVLLDPRRTWHDADAYDRMAAKLVGMFSDNFAQYEGSVSDDVLAERVKAG